MISVRSAGESSSHGEKRSGHSIPGASAALPRDEGERCHCTARARATRRFIRPPIGAYSAPALTACPRSDNAPELIAAAARRDLRRVNGRARDEFFTAAVNIFVLSYV